jgi:hypothetical protein
MLKAISDTQKMYVGEGKEKEKPVFPRFTLLENDLPEMDGWEIGDKYKLEIEVEFVAYRKGSEYDFESEKDKKNRGTFKIQKVGIAEEKKKENFQDEYARRRGESKN